MATRSPRRRGTARIKLRRDRRKTIGKFRLKKTPWIDPYPHIPGTEPEKRIFAALMRRKIYFIYQGQVPEFEKGGTHYRMAPVGYKPDFILPEYRVIIDPFSPFHHSLPEAQKRDADKIAVYEYVGYHYFHPWAMANGLFTFDQILIGRKPTKRRVFHSGRYWSYTVQALFKRGELHTRAFGAFELLALIPQLQGGPKHKLTDKRDIEAKKYPGYRIGQYVGAGANSVAAANRQRRKPPSLSLQLRR